MKIRLTQLTVNLDYTQESLLLSVAEFLAVPAEAVQSCEVVRRSIDARQRVYFILVVEAEVLDSAVENAFALEAMPGVELVREEEAPSAILPTATDFSFRLRPVVVGAGPAGLLAAWRLARSGARPILIERGAPAEDRKRSVARFWAEGKLDSEDNVLYGEGGAGLFSDGKLNTRSKRRDELRTVLKLLVECGAPEAILIDAEPHVGSDKLAEVVPQLRRKIIELGGEVRFHSRLEGVTVREGRLTAVTVNGGEIATNHCLLATGHSAREVYALLQRAGVMLEAKSFAVGVRIEVPQSQIDHSQYGLAAGHPRLGAAAFRLTRREEATARACYTFCMCPGGTVIACASSPGLLTTNGMSLSRRSDAFGNAAFLVPVGSEDFGGTADPLAGVAWQAEIERKAFEAGGGDYSLPACRLEDFLKGEVSASLPEERSCLRARPADLHTILPDFVRGTLLQAVAPMLGKLRRVRPEEALVYAAETRSSSPVRIVRDEQFQSPTARGIFPVGEGAGYAGGIVTSAIDGLRAAEAMLA